MAFATFSSIAETYNSRKPIVKPGRSQKLSTGLGLIPQISYVIDDLQLINRTSEEKIVVPIAVCEAQLTMTPGSDQSRQTLKVHNIR